ncbi:MAG: peptidylprolyl isomerase [Bacteroidota bacterium]
MPSTAGDRVLIHYTGRLDDGTVFDSSEGREPLAFTLGSGEVVPGFDRAATGLEVGESKTVRMEPADAYGERRDDMILAVPHDAFPDGVAPEVGQRLQLGLQGGGALDAAVVDVSPEAVTLDANHPLAGEALTFDVTLVDIAS